MRIFIFFLLVYPTFIFGQITSGTITYGISYEFDAEMKNGLMASYVQEAMQNAQYATFKLEFNQEAMQFYPMENMEVDGKRMAFVFAFSLSEGVYYRTKDYSKNYHSIVMERVGRDYIIKIEERLEWELTSESKMINNYLCYRANATQVVDNGVGIFTFPIIAWYCPEIPFPYGPKSYGGLPGLILELQERNALFGVQKINLSSSEKKTIDVPKKGKIVTEEEFNNIIYEANKALED